MRSVWKGFFFKNSTILNNSSTLPNTVLKKKFFIYDGKSTRLVSIDRNMIGFKIGEFVFTRKMGVSHKKKVLNKKGKKK